MHVYPILGSVTFVKENKYFYNPYSKVLRYLFVLSLYAKIDEPFDFELKF